jgi:hypothetical protein
VDNNCGVVALEDEAWAEVAALWEIYLLEFPAVRHGGDHLCELFFLTLQDSVHMLHRALQQAGRLRRTAGPTIRSCSSTTHHPFVTHCDFPRKTQPRREGEKRIQEMDPWVK